MTPSHTASPQFYSIFSPLLSLHPWKGATGRGRGAGGREGVEGGDRRFVRGERGKVGVVESPSA